MYGDKITQSVAEAVRKVMEGELKGNQHKLDVAEPKGKLTSADFKKLRGEANTEVKEGIEDRIEAAREKARAAGKPMKEPEKAKPSAVRTVAGKAYGGAAQKDEPESDDDTPQQPAKRGRGRPKGSTNKRRFNTKLYKESFSGMLEIYGQGGVKELFEDFAARTIEEEPDNEQFTKEVEAAKAKDRGEGEKAEVAKPAVQAVKQEEIEVFDANEVNGVTIETINEETDQIDEISTEKMSSYYEKRRSQLSSGPKTWELQGKGKLSKAISGARTARDKLLARAKTNEAKQIKEFNPVAAVAGTGPKVIGGVAKFGAAHSPAGQVAGSMSAKQEAKKMNENPALAALAPAAGRALASGAGSALAGAAMNKMSGSAGAQKEGIKERTLTPAESKKKEEVVKSMKKKLSGFRERYGKRAKEVMYATATKVAKGEK
jgi:hypothetical protein